MKRKLEQTEFEPMADEIVIDAKTEEETEQTIRRHEVGEIYIRGLKSGTPGKCLWQMVAVTGERAKAWHEASARKKAGKVVAEADTLPF